MMHFVNALWLGHLSGIAGIYVSFWPWMLLVPFTTAEHSSLSLGLGWDHLYVDVFMGHYINTLI